MSSKNGRIKKGILRSYRSYSLSQSLKALYVRAILRRTNPMTGGYLRTNFNRTGGLPLLDIGGGYQYTSYAGGAGLNRPYQGFVMGSVATPVNSVYAVSAYGAMSAWFGGGLYDSGYQIVPVAFVPQQVLGGTGIVALVTGVPGVNLWATMSGSIFFAFLGGSTVSVVTSSISAHFTWAGFITSGPGA